MNFRYHEEHVFEFQIWSDGKLFENSNRASGPHVSWPACLIVAFTRSTRTCPLLPDQLAAPPGFDRCQLTLHLLATPPHSAPSHSVASLLYASCRRWVSHLKYYLLPSSFTPASPSSHHKGLTTNSRLRSWSAPARTSTSTSLALCHRPLIWPLAAVSPPTEHRCHGQQSPVSSQPSRPPKSICRTVVVLLAASPTTHHRRIPGEAGPPPPSTTKASPASAWVASIGFHRPMLIRPG
jgi:hypothetical protein